MASPFIFRLRLLYVLVVAVGLVLAGRLFFVQVVRGEEYLERANRQYGRPVYTVNTRGSIFFQTKDGDLVSAATMKDGFLVAISPTQLKNPVEVYEKLVSILPDLDHETFLARAAKEGDPYEEIARRLSESESTEIEELKIPGVEIHRDRWRFYPGGSAASHLLGLVGYEGSEIIGRYGLESYYDDLLLRQPEKSFASFLAETFSALGGAVFGGASSKYEADLVLTIEPTVEETFEQELRAILLRTKAEAAGGIVIDPVTGEIRAMAALPSFDPGGKQEDVALLANPLVENVFEVGSIMKPLTMAAGLDAGVVEPETTYYDPGFVVINNRRIENYDGKGRGTVSMQEVLNQSLNTGAVFVMQQLGKNRLRDYFKQYGLGEKTKIDLPNETWGLLDTLESPREVEYATAAFGQGIAVTPIEMTRALSVLGNGGKLVWPHLVSEVLQKDTTLKNKVAPQVERVVLKPETAETITRMLVETADTALVGGRFKMERHSVAAKTGTAQMVNPEGGYYDDRYLHSFFGYFPAYQPRFLIFIYAIHPQGFRYASETLTEPFMNLAKFLINYYQIPPDR